MEEFKGEPLEPQDVVSKVGRLVAIIKHLSEKMNPHTVGTNISNSSINY
jgi:hypothetical protein